MKKGAEMLPFFSFKQKNGKNPHGMSGQHLPITHGRRCAPEKTKLKVHLSTSRFCRNLQLPCRGKTRRKSHCLCRPAWG